MPGEKASGIEFERKVEVWAKNRFKASKTVMRYHARGLSVTRPYEVDVWVRVPRGFLRHDNDIWIECKDRKASIKRKDISDLISKARDVYESANAGLHDFWFDTLMFVSTSSYDFDAIVLADQEGVACVFYDGKRYELHNEWKSSSNPKWLRDVKAV